MFIPHYSQHQEGKLYCCFYQFQWCRIHNSWFTRELYIYYHDFFPMFKYFWNVNSFISLEIFKSRNHTSIGSGKRRATRPWGHPRKFCGFLGCGKLFLVGKLVLKMRSIGHWCSSGGVQILLPRLIFFLLSGGFLLFGWFLSRLFILLASILLFAIACMV